MMATEYDRQRVNPRFVKRTGYETTKRQPIANRLPFDVESQESCPEPRAARFFFVGEEPIIID
ncbi:hypothetical protein I8J29_12930 [Paenibacillus sp. MWE-103]|uniref:Uncharacterized protein n=1 Tax=Paenibacillus artemisiicola TaxID=1172618 RepID=A0ABS3WAD0_9BACL|nr:hypothetical protein [Paenibacillus artemisiicola]MBO7745106.1 hypothetical protein [Paenibacillus artemisiicola]